MLRWIATDRSITLFTEEKSHIVSNDFFNYNNLIDYLKQNGGNIDEKVVFSMINEKEKIKEKVICDNIKLIGNSLFYTYEDGTRIEVTNALAKRIIYMINFEIDTTAILSFFKNLMNNPSKTSIEELFTFLEKNKLPITEDGHFLAYKKIRSDWKDIHSGTIDNSIGEVIEMHRNMVNDNRSEVCSSGLHFASYDYLSHFGRDLDDRIVVLKINPADVVSIPIDYNNSKGRCCRYEVLAEMPNDEFIKLKDYFIFNVEISTMRKVSEILKNVTKKYSEMSGINVEILFSHKSKISELVKESIINNYFTDIEIEISKSISKTITNIFTQEDIDKTLAALWKKIINKCF